MPETHTESQKELTTAKGKIALVEIWTKEIENSSDKEKNYRKEAESYLDTYKNQLPGRDTYGILEEGYNIFWSNVQTLRPLVYSNLPHPNITRRFLDKDETARLLSELMERALAYFNEIGNTSTTIAKARDDFLITGRGVARVIFDPADIIEIKTTKIDKETEEETIEIDEDLDIDVKKVRVAYVPWKDIRISTENVWEDVRWIAFKHDMSRDQLISRFGTKGKSVNLNSNILDDVDGSKVSDHEIFKRAEVWEIWDKTTKRIIFATIGAEGTILSDEEDAYELRDFFPIAKPLGSDSDPESLTPIPQYRMYRAQAEELNQIDARIRSLVQQVKYSGVYAALAENTNIENIMNGGDGEVSPLKGVQPGVKIGDLIEFKPILDLVNVIVSLRTQKAEILQNTRDITGLSDIVRGTTVASETATAQKLKGDFAISRIQPTQKEVELFIRDTYRLQAELIVEQYSIEELAKITNLKIIDINSIAQEAKEKQDALIEEAESQINTTSREGQQQLQRLEERREIGLKKTMEKPLNELKGYAATPEQLEQLDQVMKNDKLRNFSVDVETDATVSIDQNQEKADRLEYAQAISTFFAQATPILQVGGINKSAFNEMLSFISKPFKVGRNLEEHLLTEEEEEPQGPSIEEQMAQAENARADQRLQLDAQKQKTEADQGQQKLNIEKAKVKVDIEQFDDKLEFEDVNKEADRRAKTLDQVVKESTNRATSVIRESNLI